ncbi:MAG: hypothetical protein IT544_06335 [Rhodobacteraceae bacterium]|nr:hypothetical protein [Paracoccaceae bacterium]
MSIFITLIIEYTCDKIIENLDKFLVKHFTQKLVKFLGRKWGKRMTDAPSKSELVKKDGPEMSPGQIFFMRVSEALKNREINQENNEVGKDFREWLEKQDKVVLKKHSTINDKKD